MNFEQLVNSLERFGRMLPEVVRDVSEDDSRWKPADGAWSILEIVCHLADEEEFDFGLRTKLTITTPDAAWPPIDPAGWAIQRDYNSKDLSEVVDRFVELRQRSVTWLRELENPDWDTTYNHPRFGPFPAGALLGSWAAHDYLHLRQISKRMYQLALRDAGDYDTRYAGEWKA